MKKISFVLSFILISSIINISYSQKRAVIMGKISNNKTEKKVKISYLKHLISKQWVDFTSTIDKNGNFKIVFSINKFEPMMFNIGDKYHQIFMEPSDSLYFTADFNKYHQSFNYTGKGAENNNFNNKNYVSFSHILYEGNKIQSFYIKASTSNLENFMSNVDSSSNYYLNYLEKNKNQISDDFYNYLNMTLYYTFLKLKFIYPNVQNSKERNEKKNITPLSKYLPYYTYLDSILFDNDSLLVNESYFDFLSYYYYFKKDIVSEAFRKNKDYFYSDVSSFYLFDLVFPYKISQFLKTDYANSVMSYCPKEFLGKMYEIAKNEIKDTTFLGIIENQYQKNKNRKAEMIEGEAFRSFSMKDLDGNIVSNESLKGKVVYIDFWGSWCGQCMQEMPHSKVLKEKLTDINDKIVFLYFSCEDTEERMKKAILDNKIVGIHIKLNHEQVTNEFVIQGFPTYFLLNKEGKIAKMNVRPSDENIEKFIRELIK